MTNLKHTSRLALLLLGIFWAENHEVIAGPAPPDPAASDWIITDYGRIRIISGVTAVGNASTIPLGVQIILKPEWKTYWRSPGESGIPPRFDWTESRNLAATEVRWPAPGRYTSFDLDTIGYKNEVVLPVALQVRTPGQPVRVVVSIDYAVCRDICVPLQAQLSLLIPKDPASQSAHSPLIQDYIDQVPAKGGNGKEFAGPVLKELRQNNTDGTEQLYALINGLMNAGKFDLFVEAGDDFGFGVPKITRGQRPDEVEFSIPVHRYRKKVNLSSVPVTLTLNSGSSAFEWSTTVTAD